MCCVVFTLRKPTSGFIQTAADTGGAEPSCKTILSNARSYSFFPG